MKTLRSFITVMVIMIAVAGAYASKKSNPNAGKRFATSWYTYNGGPVNNVASYDLFSGTPSCPGTGALCAINATTGAANHPDATAFAADAPLQAQIVTVNSGGADQPRALAVNP
ncbi:hypothetical protein [Chitinophaga defluvii]|uniref:Uncharacterized protein n=1 Tax=Chitinophaga defluvii TaxID=3163343 RepID=A0ABV2TCB8_9BACT